MNVELKVGLWGLDGYLCVRKKPKMNLEKKPGPVERYGLGLLNCLHLLSPAFQNSINLIPQDCQKWEKWKICQVEKSDLAKNLLARSTTSATASKEGKVPVSSLEKTLKYISGEISSKKSHFNFWI